MAHKKGGGSSRNGRDSNSQRLGDFVPFVRMLGHLRDQSSRQLGGVIHGMQRAGSERFRKPNFACALLQWARAFQRKRSEQPLRQNVLQFLQASNHPHLDGRNQSLAAVQRHGRCVMFGPRATAVERQMVVKQGIVGKCNIGQGHGDVGN